MAKDVILDIRDLRLSFGGLTVLHGISLSALRNDVTAIIGPNGAGKTAALNCVSGIYRPQAGSIFLGGQPLIGLAPHKVALAGVGRSFQNLELFGSLTVIQNLLVARDRHFKGGVLRAAMFGRWFSSAEAQQRDRVEEVIDFFELWQDRNTPAQDLSYGRQKIVGLARALALDPRLLLLDEPGSGLTRDEKEDLARFILRLRSSNEVSILWIEHDLQMVLELADVVHVLQAGVCIASGTPEAVRKHPQVIQAYVAT